MQSETDSLLQKISGGLQQAFEDINTWRPEEMKSSAHWTSKVKGAVSKLAPAEDCQVRLSSQGKNWEFLYDTCFLDTGNQVVGDGYFVEGCYLRRMVMALECEWSKSFCEILYDFTKLLVTKASLKVLVFWEPTGLEAEAVFEQVRQAIRAFSQPSPGERYLIAGITDETKTFTFRVFDETGTLVNAY
jgi:hypothetical protein